MFFVYTVFSNDNLLFFYVITMTYHPFKEIFVYICSSYNCPAVITTKNNCTEVLIKVNIIMQLLKPTEYVGDFAFSRVYQLRNF